MDKVLFSRKSDNWKTPELIYKRYMNKGYFDPCPYESNFDGLLIEWGEKNFVNPPYSKIKDFVDKAIELIDLIKPELWNLSNKMTYRLIDIENILKGEDKQ